MDIAVSRLEFERPRDPRRRGAIGADKGQRSGRGLGSVGLGFHLDAARQVHPQPVGRVVGLPGHPQVVRAGRRHEVVLNAGHAGRVIPRGRGQDRVRSVSQLEPGIKARLIAGLEHESDPVPGLGVKTPIVEVTRDRERSDAKRGMEGRSLRRFRQGQGRGERKNPVVGVLDPSQRRIDDAEGAFEGRDRNPRGIGQPGEGAEA